jgi:hypothetical protein
VPGPGEGDAAWLACYRAVFGPHPAVANDPAAP